MASITVRNLDESLERRLRIRAAQNGHSMEQEARNILSEALRRPLTGKELVDAIRWRFEPLGSMELELPPREPIREPPTLGGTEDTQPGIAS